MEEPDAEVTVLKGHSTIPIDGWVLALSFVGCLPVAYTCFRHELWIPSILFLGLAGVSVYCHYNAREQGGAFMKTITVIQLITFSLMAATAYNSLREQQTDIVPFLAIGGLYILKNVIINFIKKPNRYQK